MSNILTKMIPTWIKDKCFTLVRRQLKGYNQVQSNKIPKHAISHATISNTKLLLNREELLKLLPKHGVVAEIGVDQGSFSEKIMSICSPSKLHLVDVWGSKRYNQKKKQGVETKFEKQISEGKLQIDIGYSTEVGATFDNDYFDWVYIDTDHSYETTIKELEILRPKLKKDGIIAGHDYIIGNWDGMVRYGVIEAVYEFCSKYNWEIIYLTMEHDNNPSFAIKKI